MKLKKGNKIIIHDAEYLESVGYKYNESYNGYIREEHEAISRALTGKAAKVVFPANTLYTKKDNCIVEHADIREGIGWFYVPCSAIKKKVRRRR